MRSVHLTRRSILGAGLTLAVSGCDAPILSNAGSLARGLIAGYPPLDLEREQISAIPYASMAARIGRGGPQSLLVLSRTEGRDLHWISTDQVVLVTRGGRLVKTYGFPVNLKETVQIGDDPVDKTLHRATGRETWTRRMVFDGPQRYEVDVDSTFHPLGRETIMVFEVELVVDVIAERNRARQVNWEFENLYWVDFGDGYVWQSSQHVSRTFDPIFSQVLKPPGRT